MSDNSKNTQTNDFIKSIAVMSESQQKSLFIIATIFNEKELEKIAKRIQEPSVKTTLVNLL